MESANPWPNWNLSRAEEESPNWLDLPKDITITILKKLGAVEVLQNVQFVCKSWHNLSKDPSVWRTIDMINLSTPSDGYVYGKMCYHAIDRSSAGLVDFRIACFGDDDLVMYMAERSSGLKRLCIEGYDMIYDAETFPKILEKLPLLEEVELSLGDFTEEQVRAVGSKCFLLKTFKLNQRGYKNPEYADDTEALAVAETMPQLHHLELIGNLMTNKGLEAILDNCPHLEYLDLRACFHVCLTSNLRKRCVEHVKELRWPNDPVPTVFLPEPLLHDRYMCSGQSYSRFTSYDIYDDGEYDYSSGGDFDEYDAMFDDDDDVECYFG